MKSFLAAVLVAVLCVGFVCAAACPCDACPQQVVAAPQAVVTYAPQPQFITAPQFYYQPQQFVAAPQKVIAAPQKVVAQAVVVNGPGPLGRLIDAIQANRQARQAVRQSRQVQLIVQGHH